MMAMLTSLISPRNNQDQRGRAVFTSHNQHVVEYRVVATSQDSGFAILTTIGYSLVPFYKCSPRAGKLGPWAKSLPAASFCK